MITISAERARIKRRLVREAGIDEHRLVSSHTLNIPVLQLYDDPELTVGRLTEMMGEAREKGAEAMLIGCMSVAFMEPALLHRASQEARMPLINPIVTAVKMAEALVAMDQFGAQAA